MGVYLGKTENELISFLTDELNDNVDTYKHVDNAVFMEKLDRVPLTFINVKKNVVTSLIDGSVGKSNGNMRFWGSRKKDVKKHNHDSETNVLQLVLCNGNAVIGKFKKKLSYNC